MTVTSFLSLLATCATVTSMLVECIKRILAEKEIKYSCNLLAIIVGCVVGMFSTACFYIMYKIVWDAPNVVAMILMGIASALTAMGTYDKVIQLIDQISKMGK